MRKENILVIVLVCLVLGTAWSLVDHRQNTGISDQSESISHSGGIQWYEYQQGMELAAAQEKPVFLYFHAAWCNYCKKLQKTTFADKKVIQALNQNFVCVSVDVDKSTDLAKNWNIAGLPMMWFLGPGSAQLARIPGFIGPRTFLKTLEDVLQRWQKE